MNFTEEIKNNKGLQDETRKAIFAAIEGVAKKNGGSVAAELEKSYENKPANVGCVKITNTNFCITL